MHLPKWLSVFSLILFSISAFAGSPALKGKTTSEKDYVRLYRQYGAYHYILDSLKVKNQKFEYDPKELKPGVYRLGFKSDNTFPVILTEEATTDVLINTENPAEKSVLTESPDSKLYHLYLYKNQDFSDNLRSLENRFKSIVPLKQSDPEKFNQEWNALREEFSQMSYLKNDFYKASIDSAQSDYMKGFFKHLYYPNNTKVSFLNENEFNEDVYPYSDLIDTKINAYFLNSGNLSAENMDSKMGEVLALFNEGSLSRDVAYSALIRIASTMDINHAIALSEKHIEEYPNSNVALELNELLPKPAPQIGDKAPEISMPGPNGNVIKLSSLKGKVVLLDFWASWCGPCRRESPHVVSAYNKYKDNGFTVYSVSLDGDKKRWMNAIESDNLIWPNHVSELNKWNSTASKRYHVRGIPATFLIDENGTIIAKNLRGNQLHQTLENIFEEK